MTKSIGVVIAAHILFGSVVKAEDIQPIETAKSYVLAKKERHLPIGSIIETSNRMSMKDADLKIKVQEQLIDGGMMISSEEVEKVEILEEKKRRVTLVKAESKQKMVINGNPAPIPNEEKALVGKPVILTLKDGQWSGELEEGKANADEEEDVKDLEERFNSDSDFSAYGDAPRKVGDEWEADGAEVMRIEDMVGKIRFKFARVERFQGVECAVLNCNFKVKGVDDELGGIEMTMKGKATIYRSLRDLVDIHVEFNGEMAMDGMMSPEPGLDMEMKIRGKMKMKMKYATKVTRP